MNDAVALVLSCGINRDGTLSEDPKRSVEIAARLFKEGAVQLFIFSGYLSYKAAFTVKVGEAATMKRYALTLGIPEENILLEEESKDTLGNLYFTKVNYLIPLGVTKFRVILGPNHSLERVKYICKKVLGPAYRVTFIEHNAHRVAEAEREERSLKLLREWLNPLADGDHKAIYKLMKSKHPGYADNPARAKQEMEQTLKELSTHSL